MSSGGFAGEWPGLPVPDAGLLDLADGRVPIATWWSPTPGVLGVLAPADESDVDVPELGERIAADPGWNGRPVVLAGVEPAAGWLVQVLADQLQAPVITAADPAGTSGWHVARPRTAAGGTRLPSLLTGRYPVAVSAVESATADPTAIPVTAASAPPCLANAELAIPGAAEWATARLPSEIRSPVGAYAVLLELAGDARRPFLFGDEQVTCWQAATALWAVRDHWHGQVLALHPPATPRAYAQILANYLGVSVRYAGPDASWPVCQPRDAAAVRSGVAVQLDAAAAPEDPVFSSVRFITDLAELFDDPTETPVTRPTATVVPRSGLPSDGRAGGPVTVPVPPVAGHVDGRTTTEVAVATAPMVTALPETRSSALRDHATVVHAVVPRRPPASVRHLPVDGPSAAKPGRTAIADLAPPDGPAVPPPLPVPPSEPTRRSEPVLEPEPATTADPAEAGQVLRELLGWRYDVHARAVSRLLAQRPGMRDTSGPEALVTELVAVSALLHHDPVPALSTDRSATPEQRIYTGCFLRGLARLPAHFGPVYSVVLPADPNTHIDATVYASGRVFVEPGVLAASTAFPSITEAVVGRRLAIWSWSGRRVEGLAERAARMVLFPPELAFQVLLAELDGTGAGWVYLRELPSGTGAGPATGDHGDSSYILDRLRSATGGEIQTK
ncbi:hypothetical protein O7632_13300 [Solwaraspora sp. WMMD406]|uniref:hypothetical protein n=1 Tax=Solwaraspora sp. WMMD406 TaxID=3016095 RepID=UPI002416DBDB|nr:hypothetical protein [Solwaraspora sp. WMMD406]MDG4765067.1 hypothetical protein [Solwaraspora sp. WMMD406]